MAKNVKLIRMLGEEVIAEVVSEGDTTITVKNAVRIVCILAMSGNVNVHHDPAKKIHTSTYVISEYVGTSTYVVVI